MSLFSEYTFWFYIAGWAVTLYPYIWAYIYWAATKEKDTLRLTFSQISKAL